MVRLDRKVNRLVYRCSAAAGAVDAGASMAPGVGHLGISMIQAAMIVSIANLYGNNMNLAVATGIITQISGTYIAPLVAKEAVGWIPGFGTAVKAGIAMSVTSAVGAGTVRILRDEAGAKLAEPGWMARALFRMLKPFEVTINCMVQVLGADLGNKDGVMSAMYQCLTGAFDEETGAGRNVNLKQMECMQMFGRIWYEIDDILPDGRRASEPMCA